MFTRFTQTKSDFQMRAVTALAGVPCALLALACAATVGISHAAQNPTASSFSVAVAANLSTPITLQGTDPNGLPLFYEIFTSMGPSHGTLNTIFGPMPTVIYTPDPNYLGPDRFSYVTIDSVGSSTLATVSITVKKGLLINNVSLAEGNSDITSFTFTVTMTVPGSVFDVLDPVTVNYRTLDGTAVGASPPATVGADYLTRSGTLSFVGSTTRTITVPVIGDTGVEQSETFLVQLTSASANAIIVKGTGRGTIVNDDFNIVCCAVAIGSAELTPENSMVEVGQPITLSLAWTHPVGWRQLDSVDLLISGDEGTVLRARWHQTANAFSLLNSAADKFLPTAEAGSPARLETPAVALRLLESSGDGLPGQVVTINYNLSFKPQAAGRTFSVEAFATDDEGNQQGYESVGTVTVLPWEFTTAKSPFVDP